MRSEVSSEPNAILYETCWSIYVSANDAEMFNTESWQLIYCLSKKNMKYSTDIILILFPILLFKFSNKFL